MIPVVYLMGVPWKDCRIVGEVVGLKTVVNEFVGYTRLGDFIKIKAISVSNFFPKYFFSFSHPFMCYTEIVC